ncbi:MAG: hypothetical protein AB7V18_18550 [Pyrinomonadaceae bacterium]
MESGFLSIAPGGSRIGDGLRDIWEKTESGRKKAETNKKMAKKADMGKLRFAPKIIVSKPVSKFPLE